MGQQFAGNGRIIGSFAEVIVVLRVPLIVTVVLSLTLFDLLIEGSMREAMRYVLLDRPVQLIGIALGLAGVCFAVQFTSSAMLRAYYGDFPEADRLAAAFAAYAPSAFSMLISFSLGLPFILMAMDSSALIVDVARLVSALSGVGFICIGIISGLVWRGSLERTLSEPAPTGALSIVLALIPLALIALVSGAFFEPAWRSSDGSLALRIASQWYWVIAFVFALYCAALALRASLETLLQPNNLSDAAGAHKLLHWILPRTFTAAILLALVWNWFGVPRAYQELPALLGSMRDFVQTGNWSSELELLLRLCVLAIGTFTAWLLGSGFLFLSARKGQVFSADLPRRFAVNWTKGAAQLAAMPVYWQLTFVALLLVAFGISVFAMVALTTETGSKLASDIGPLAITLLWGFAASVLFFPIAYMAHAVKMPLLTGLLAVAIAFSVLDLNDNHAVRTLPTAEVSDRARQAGQAAFGAPFDLGQWLKSRADRHHFKRYPVFIIATEGGGMRSAYFTASVLGAIQDVCPSFAQHIVAVSGVSGGSVGAAVFNATAADLATNEPFRECGGALKAVVADPKQTVQPFRFTYLARTSLARDLLSPLLGAMLFPDAVQRVIPVPVPRFDRAYSLEVALESAWSEACRLLMESDSRVVGNEARLSRVCNEKRMSAPFADLYSKGSHSSAQPHLIFNAAEVASGRIAPLASTSDILGLTEKRVQAERASGTPKPQEMVELINDRIRNVDQIPLSTAALVSARFPYLSPAARVDDVRNGSVSRFVDGGYFENSGTWIATAFARNLLDQSAAAQKYQDEEVRELLGNVDIYVIVVGSNPPCSKVPAGSSGVRISCAPTRSVEVAGGNELLSPVRALLNARSARADYSRLDLMLLARSMRKACPQREGSAPEEVETFGVSGCPEQTKGPTLSVLELSFLNASGEEVPLTWLLSSQARQSMDGAIDSMVERMARVLEVPADQLSDMRPRFLGSKAIQDQRRLLDRDNDTVEGDIEKLVCALVGKKSVERPLPGEPCLRDTPPVVNVGNAGTIARADADATTQSLAKRKHQP